MERKNLCYLNSKFEKKITILIFGGSQGADFLQNNLKKCMVELSKNFEIFFKLSQFQKIIRKI